MHSEVLCVCSIRRVILPLTICSYQGHQSNSVPRQPKDLFIMAYSPDYWANNSRPGKRGVTLGMPPCCWDSGDEFASKFKNVVKIILFKVNWYHAANTQDIRFHCWYIGTHFNSMWRSINAIIWRIIQSISLPFAGIWGMSRMQLPTICIHIASHINERATTLRCLKSNLNRYI